MADLDFCLDSDLDLFTSILNSSCLKDKSGVKWIWDMFGMITNWNVCFGAKKRKTAYSIKMLFLADSIKTL